MFRVKRIKHVTVISEDMEATTARYREIFNFGSPHPGTMPQFGLVNYHFPVGDSFVEVLQPTDSARSGAKFLERFGPGFYMLIFEMEDQPAAVEHLENMGAKLTLKGAREGAGYRNIHIHPATNLGPLLGLGEPLGENSWPPGGPAWEPERRTDVVRMFREAVLVTPDLDQMVGRYQRLFGFPAPSFSREPSGDLRARIAVGPTVLEITQPGGAGPAAEFLSRRGPGLFEVRVEVNNLSAAMKRASHAGVPVEASESLAGTGVLLHPEAMFGARWVLFERTEGNR